MGSRDLLFMRRQGFIRVQLTADEFYDSFQVLYNSLRRGLAVMDMVKSWEQDIPLY